MVMKRKAVVKNTEQVFGRPKTKVTKQEMMTEDPEAEEEDEEEEVEETPKLSKEQLLAKKEKEEKAQEKETVANREKELKSMYVEELKKLAEGKGLQISKRDEMIKAIVKVEAKERAAKREHEATIRAVVAEKKEQLEALSAPDLKSLCNEKGIKGVLSKQERVKTLLGVWVEDDGINKALLQQARKERETELDALDKQALKKLCDKAGIDVFLKDVMVDRIVLAENEKGKFLRPSATLDKDMVDVVPVVPKSATKSDLVETLLTKQKEDKEMIQKKTEEAAQLAQKVKDVSKKSVDELKKLLTKKKMEVPAKKEEMVKALVDADIQEEAVAARKTELQSMGGDVISKLLASRGLSTNKSKNTMVETLLTYEADIQKKLKAYETKMIEVVAKKRDELQNKTGNELKEMCLGNGLAGGGGKEDRVSRLLEVSQNNGELDSILSKTLRHERKASLDAMDRKDLITLCEDLAIDPLVKEVMIERLLSHEAESGEPVAKKAKRSHN